MSSYVLDASALLALLQQETGTDKVVAVLQDSAVSTVNWSEVIQKSLAYGIDTDAMQDEFEALGVEIIPFTISQAEVAAQLWQQTKVVGLSFGDRACLALAMEQQAIAVTADKTWAQLTIGIGIHVIR
ncbi:MAG: type II toxin-antitoxin system VapC family toxin [Aphanocapsa sp. GSE-SYN-MK-11-07L]|jgi:PIN domain nuclease of toxin-antitoxin system|nr:type II toxin-antitoxin system VapC family toxin [Aphanocapsa sp. GSE-SYN-MK-11-07L]